MLHVLGDILLVTSADESRRQIVVCPPVYAAGLAVSPCGVTSADERRRQIVVCPPVYAAGLAISPCGADTMVSKGLRLDLGTKVYRTVHFVHTGYAVDSTQSIHKFSISSYKKQNKKMYYCSAS